ncbi:hypothetical protein SAMN02746065_11038 [Desulfocicer vacuolatum DSM 3385]|uniref:DNA repair protein n=1 Tax=Desulfocicer vacuolatum DSM 3385 TaxID=1121400 RepID=A0A1W2C068_9BACT|nr:CRISPR-associated endonuclease Cas6 [Desulfocicer vacuolatum]SMC78569.1 hypothetical protein SAMN02746065_11038 [Desulfocicer vacuolatum DSM 3385]
MKKATLYFNNIRLNPSQIHKLRGYVGNVFSEYDLIHNHDLDTGKYIYRYPLIQFKIIDKTPCIIALTEKAVQVFTKIFLTLDEIDIGGRIIPINEKDIKIENVDFGFSKETFVYEFITPWIALNQRNYGKFKDMKTIEDKRALLKRILTGNILSMAKYLGCHLEQDQRIQSTLNFRQAKATLKGKSMVGFEGMFKTNFLLPDHTGIGKSVSRGYGCIKKCI